MAVALFCCCNGGSNGNEITDLLEKKTSAFFHQLTQKHVAQLGAVVTA